MTDPFWIAALTTTALAAGLYVREVSCLSSDFLSEVAVGTSYGGGGGGSATTHSRRTNMPVFTNTLLTNNHASLS